LTPGIRADMLVGIGMSPSWSLNGGRRLRAEDARAVELARGQRTHETSAVGGRAAGAVAAGLELGRRRYRALGASVPSGWRGGSA
jgi:hypothetical protein